MQEKLQIHELSHRELYVICLQVSHVPQNMKLNCSKIINQGTLNQDITAVALMEDKDKPHMIEC